MNTLLNKIAKMFSTGCCEPVWQHGISFENALFDMDLMTVLQSCPERATYKVLDRGTAGINNPRIQRMSAKLIAAQGVQDCAVQISHIEAHMPCAAKMLAEIASAVNMPALKRSNVNLYAADIRTGLDWHYDIDFALSVQMSGVKVWRFSPPNEYCQDQHPYMVGDDNAKRFSVGSYSEVTLQAGDALFIPRGWWHATQTIEKSLSVSFIYEIN